MLRASAYKALASPRMPLTSLQTLMYSFIDPSVGVMQLVKCYAWYGIVG